MRPLGAGSRILVTERNLRGLRGLTFDAFGTLLDAGAKDAIAVLRDALHEAGADFDSRQLEDRWMESFHHHLPREPFISFREVHRRAFEELFLRLGVSSPTEVCVEETFERYRRANVHPEVHAVIGELEKDFPLAVVSNMDTEPLLAALQRNGLTFTFVITSEEEQSYKPASPPFERATRYLGLPPANILHVGDSYAEDVVGASSAGMEAALILRSAGTEPRPRGVKHVVLDLREVRELLYRSWDAS